MYYSLSVFRFAPGPGIAPGHSPAPPQPTKPTQPAGPSKVKKAADPEPTRTTSGFGGLDPLIFKKKNHQAMPGGPQAGDIQQLPRRGGIGGIFSRLPLIAVP